MTTRTLTTATALFLLSSPAIFAKTPFLPAATPVSPGWAAIAVGPGQPPDQAQDAKADEDRERENDLYDSAYGALDDGEWTEAIERFRSVVELSGARADAAMYWSAYAQSRLGLGAETLETLSELVAGFPTSRYLRDAGALEVEVRQQGGQPPDPDDVADEELKLLAIQGLLHTDSERAVPLLEGLLTGGQSPKLRERALFVLARVDSAESARLLAEVARGRYTPDLQRKAIQYLGMVDAEGNRGLLAEIYAATNDSAIKTRVLRAFMLAGDTDRVFQAATGESDEALRGQAIRLLGMMGAREELRQLYEADASRDQKLQVLRAMFLGGDSARLIQLLDIESDLELRLAIIRNLGLVGDTGDVLRETYASETDPRVRRAVIQALFIQQADGALVEMARQETDRELQRDIVRKLSLMDSEAALAYLLEILER